jgi:hypothetical protein
MLIEIIALSLGKRYQIVATQRLLAATNVRALWLLGLAFQDVDDGVGMDEELFPDWTRDEVDAQLAKILLDPEFVRNKSVSRFLKFVVEETLDGRGARLKAFTVGVAVFSRDETFDAQNSSIVRVQAARLRQLLEFYYVNGGAKTGHRGGVKFGQSRAGRATDARRPPTVAGRGCAGGRTPSSGGAAR